ncbi:serine hydrolase [Acuticoccus sediminis]|uniref:Serine hydrolase n=2 Tax=Acuticoccus sediminis TaxID=2184697 RepID=A0A8B2P4K7_9HYPH|nr:serine hydrolase [Acuticoccus sediminis]
MPWRRLYFSRCRIQFASLLLSMGLATLAVAQATADERTIGSFDSATSESIRAAIPKLETYIEALIEADAVPGLAVAIVSGDQVYLNGFGVREAGAPEHVDADTVFQIASLSKPISSTIVAALMSDGAFDWDTRISQIDPSFQLFEPYPTANVTVSDLLSHRSGLPGLVGDELLAYGFDRATILRRLRLVRPAYSFRGGYEYSNSGFTEGAVAAAAAVGLAWEEAAETLLFGPLGMASTSMRYGDYLARGNRAELHVRYDDRWQALVKHDTDAQAPAGGVSTSVRDLARWMTLVLGNGVIDGRRLAPEDALAASHAALSHIGSDPIGGEPVFYGLGWALIYGNNGRVWTHAGALTAGARSLATFYPDKGFAIAVLSNAHPTGAPEAVVDRFVDLVLSGGDGPDTIETWNGIYASMVPESPSAKDYGSLPQWLSPPLSPQAYVGTYHNAYVGTAVVTASDDGILNLALGPEGGLQRPLRHFNRDQFTFFLLEEVPDTPFGISFQIGAQGVATSMNIDDITDSGFGRLERVGDAP